MSVATPGLLTTLGVDPAEVPRARRLVAQRLAEWHTDVDRDVVLLLTSELVTNALLHARPPVELRVSPAGHGLRVEVHDAAAHRTPGRRDTLDLEGLTGRGLTLVEALSTRWGWEEDSTGKRVWFELDGA